MADASSAIGSIGAADVPSIIGSIGETDVPSIIGSIGETDVPSVIGSIGAADVPGDVGSNGEADNTVEIVRAVRIDSIGNRRRSSIGTCGLGRSGQAFFVAAFAGNSRCRCRIRSACTARTARSPRRPFAGFRCARAG
ncbi:hypothetical protein [Paraburkholderia sp. SIMBA_030]|uniref:hypothetical protein n=1 Tax=Paraburkholderia sp. SIMBA_030 TaxID=3085773 RepID=UPI00397DED36